MDVKRYASAFGRFLKGFLGFAVAAAPVAASVAKATGNDEVVDDINKAGMAAKAAEALSNSLPVE